MQISIRAEFDKNKNLMQTFDLFIQIGFKMLHTLFENLIQKNFTRNVHCTDYKLVADK